MRKLSSNSHKVATLSKVNKLNSYRLNFSISISLSRHDASCNILCNIKHDTENLINVIDAKCIPHLLFFSISRSSLPSCAMQHGKVKKKLPSASWEKVKHELNKNSFISLYFHGYCTLRSAILSTFEIVWSWKNRSKHTSEYQRHPKHLTIKINWLLCGIFQIEILYACKTVQ